MFSEPNVPASADATLSQKPWRRLPREISRSGA